MFAALPPGDLPRHRDLHLVRAERGSCATADGFAADQQNLARVREYLADMVRPYQRELMPAMAGEPLPAALGQSYGELAEPLIRAAVPASEPAGLLVLAFSVHDLRPGRQTAAYLSHLTPGAPMAFSVCDQGSAAAFTGLRIACEYAASAGVSRALVIVAEQAVIPYECAVPAPERQQAVAMLYGTGAISKPAVIGVRQHPGAAASSVASLATADLRALAAGQTEVSLVLSEALASVWSPPAAARVRVTGAGQPSTGVWWGLLDELARDGGPPGLLVVADYDPGLRYLCLAAFGHAAATSAG